MVNLDATAGNRMIWGENKYPPDWVFIDNEYQLARPPDIFCDNTRLPFREDFKFDVILFDPPWGYNMPPWWTNPASTGNQYGNFKRKSQLVAYLARAAAELTKYTDRICLKWGERNIKTWKILGLFTRPGFREVFRRETGGIKSNTKNF